jgi:hypothetical protein
VCRDLRMITFKARVRRWMTLYGHQPLGMTDGESEQAEDGRSDANNKAIIIGTQIPQAKGKTWPRHETFFAK